MCKLLSKKIEKRFIFNDALLIDKQNEIYNKTINLTIGTHNTIIRMPYCSSKCYFSKNKEEFRIVNYDNYNRVGKKTDK